MKTVSFLGMLGCGKSTWCNCLKQYGYPTIFEDLNDITYLKPYWNNRNYAFETQIEFYVSWLIQYNTLVSQNFGGFMDSSILSHHFVFTNYMHNNNIICDGQYKICEKLFNSSMNLITCDWVFLHCDIDELRSRVKMRNRNGEINSISFLHEIYTYYQKIVTLYHPYIIDITHLSPTNPNDVNQFLNQLKERGTL